VCADNDMKRRCAWCGKDMGTKPGPDGETTHGMCPECLARIEKEEGMSETERRHAAAKVGAEKWGAVQNAKPFKCSCGGTIEMVPGQDKDEDPDYECDECGTIFRRDDWRSDRLKAVNENPPTESELYEKHVKEKHGGKLADCKKCEKFIVGNAHAPGCACGHSYEDHEVDDDGFMPCMKCSRCWTYHKSISESVDNSKTFLFDSPEGAQRASGLAPAAGIVGVSGRMVTLKDQSVAEAKKSWAEDGFVEGEEYRAYNKDERPSPPCKKCSHPLLDHNNDGCWFPGCDCTRSRLENV
jgi:uncharacterized C2H2 Zn-finger protein